MALIGGLLIPSNCLVIILGYSKTGLIDCTQEELGLGMALIGCFPIPSHRLAVIPSNHTMAFSIRHAQLELCVGITTVGIFLQLLLFFFLPLSFGFLLPHFLSCLLSLLLFLLLVFLVLFLESYQSYNGKKNNNRTSCS